MTGGPNDLGAQGGCPAYQHYRAGPDTITRIAATLYLLDTIEHLKLFWDMDGATHVISGVLVVYSLSFARVRRCSRPTRTWNIWQ